MKFSRIPFTALKTSSLFASSFNFKKLIRIAEPSNGTRLSVLRSSAIESTVIMSLMMGSMFPLTMLTWLGCAEYASRTRASETTEVMLVDEMFGLPLPPLTPISVTAKPLNLSPFQNYRNLLRWICDLGLWFVTRGFWVAIWDSWFILGCVLHVGSGLCSSFGFLDIVVAFTEWTHSKKIFYFMIIFNSR